MTKESVKDLLQSLIALEEPIKQAAADVAEILEILRYVAQGGDLIVCLDTAEVVRHFLPSSELVGRESGWTPSREFMEQQIALAFLFSSQGPFGAEGVVDFVLLPPYELELAEYLARLQAGLNWPEMLRRVQQRKMSRFLEEYLDPEDLELILEIVKKPKRSEQLSDEEINEVDRLLREKYRELATGLWFLTSNLAAELRELKGFVGTTGRLQDLEEALAKRQLALTLDNEELWEKSQDLFKELYELRDRSPKFFPNCRRDALALQYVYELNERLLPKHLVLLITHSKAVVCTGKGELRVLPVDQSKGIRPIIDLHKVLVFMFLLQLDDYRYDRCATIDFASRLIQTSRSFLEESDEIRAFIATGRELRRQRFVAKTSEVAIHELLALVNSSRDFQLATKGLAYVDIYTKRAEKVAKSLKDASTRAVVQFLQLVGRQQKMLRQTKHDADRLIKSFNDCQRELRSILHLVRLNLQKIDERTLMGYTPNFRSSGLESIFEQIQSLLSSQKGISRIYDLLTEAYLQFPSHPERRIISAYVYFKQASYKSALAEIRTAVMSSTNVDRPTFLYLLLFFLRIDGAYKKAWELLQSQISVLPESALNPFILREKAILLYHLNPTNEEKVKEAVTTNEQAKELSQNKPELMPYLCNNEAYLYARLFELTGEESFLLMAEQAIKKLAHITEEKSWPAEFIHTAGVVYLNRGIKRETDVKGSGKETLAKAKEHIELAIECNPSVKEFFDDLQRAETSISSDDCAMHKRSFN